MIKNIVKLVIAYWVVKHFVLDNKLLAGIKGKIKDNAKQVLDKC